MLEVRYRDYQARRLYDQHGSARATDLTRLENLPAQPRRRHRVHRLIRAALHLVQAARWSSDSRPLRGRLVRISVTTNPTGEWIAGQEAFPWVEAPRHLIRDRDGSFGSGVCPTRAHNGNL